MSILLVALSAALCPAAERVFDFSHVQPGQSPPGFESAVGGEGQPGRWEIVLDEIPSALPPLFHRPGAPQNTKAVLAQSARDSTDEHFPMLIYQGDNFRDFTLTTKLKMVAGSAEQMAGIAFRLQDVNNYYYIRASSLGNTLRFYKVVKGQRSEPIGVDLPIPRGVWHELAIQCKGNQINCQFDGKQVGWDGTHPTITDNTFSSGRIAFWTKSDSVSYFTDTKIVYTPRVPLAQTLVRLSLDRYPRLIGLQIYAFKANSDRPRVLASNLPEQIGQLGGKIEADVIRRGVKYCGKNEGKVVVTLPLHDRNGDTIAAVRVTMRSFPGQTEANALARAMPILRSMELRTSSEPLFE